MNTDEFAFFNQQLAAMLRDGLPLEGSLRQLIATMQRSALRDELGLLADDLSRGAPLPEALSRRRLPELYQRLLIVGGKGNDLPGILTLVADYYQRQHALWTRLKGLMVYPVLLLIAAFFLSVLLWQLTSRVVFPAWWDSVVGLGSGRALPAATRMALPLLQNSWVFPLLFTVPLLGVLLLWLRPDWRQRLLDRLPAFREARLAQTANAAELLLHGGLPLPEALALLADFQPANRLRDELLAWRNNIAAGVKRFSAVAAGSRYVPPLFIWLVDSAGEDIRTGFRQAGEIFAARATARSETLLYAALPVSVLAVGSVVMLQGYLVATSYLVFIDLLNNLGM
ncbi:MAG TPA: type II secretion system F family protein [Verrucomicrobiae bacterium]|nr:type II secretion system F family protein [Verrucomicrobiae bacterium]